MRLTYFLLLVQSSALLAMPGSARAAGSPRYGGTLRIEMHVSNVSLDPREWQAGSLETAADEKLATLMFERLVALDKYGRFRPVLATDWSHDPAYRQWRFTIRAGVKFSDGAALTPADVVGALQPLLPGTQKISTSGGTVVIQSASAMPDLLEELASSRYFVFRTLANGVLVGTGPFVLTDAPISARRGEEKSSAATPSEIPDDTVARGGPGHVIFRANNEAWSGRPFVDGIDVILGIPPLRAMFDLQLGKADLIELAPDLVPRAKQANLRIWTSEPVTLYALRFDESDPATADVHLREALSLSLDRGTIANVLLQKQAQTAAALLPQWLSGYAFLFNVETNLERAKELRRAVPANEAAGAEPLRLYVDPAGELAKLLAERVAVNARHAGILVQVLDRPVTRAGGSSPRLAEASADVHLFAWRYASLSSREELDSMFAAYNLKEPSEADIAKMDYQHLYTSERQVLEEWRILPLVTEAESVGLGPAVRNWMPAPWNEWHLADVWLDATEPGAKP